MPRNPCRFQVYCALAALALMPARGLADPPPGYYDSVDESSAAQLRATLHAVIDGHTVYPYSSSSTDTWDILEAAETDPANSSNILDVYKNSSIAKFGGGDGPYNREHSWPNSYGFPNNSSHPYTDCHHLFLCDVTYNSNRANLPYGNCSPGATEKPTVFNNGQGGGSGVFPGNSNWYNGFYWQTWIGRKGDVARAMFYMDVRYEGDGAEPDLILTDNASLIQSSSGGTAYMGLLSVLLQWNAEDPPDDWERNRNDVVFSYQHNRNPFVDHPEWVTGIFVASTGPTIVAILDVPADQGSWLQMDWDRNSLDIVNSAAPIAHYVIQRLEGTWVDVVTEPATQQASYSLQIATGDIASPGNPTPYSLYRVAAVETSGFVRASGTDSAYSVDNLPPPQPVVSLDTNGGPWVLSWDAPAIPDLDDACVYRGDAPGFTPGAPLVCTSSNEYQEFDTINPHYYVVQFTDTHGNTSVFSDEVGSTATDVPAARLLLQTAITSVSPNPFNPATRVTFSLAQPGPARIDIFTANGRFVRTLVNATHTAGTFDVRWDGRDDHGLPAATGTYWLRLQSGGRIDAQKALLLK